MSKQKIVHMADQTDSSEKLLLTQGSEPGWDTRTWKQGGGLKTISSFPCRANVFEVRLHKKLQVCWEDQKETVYCLQNCTD